MCWSIRRMRSWSPLPTASAEPDLHCTFSNAAGRAAGYILARRRRSALETTETELMAMAAPAKMGESRMPKNG